MSRSEPKEILVRGTNWVGDAVMTLPALRALAANYPESRLTVLTKPWAGGVYQDQEGVAEVLTPDFKTTYRGPLGRWKLGRELKTRGYDLAVLFQNAFEAALTSFLARIPRRWGYARDSRSLLLTKSIELAPIWRYVHESFYYLHLLEELGIPAPFSRPRLRPSPLAEEEADELWRDSGAGPDDFILALAPGAAFGPAKRWPLESFARAAEIILEKHPGRAMILGGEGEAHDAARLEGMLGGRPMNFAGRVSLPGSMALLARSSLLITNDSGLMHLGGGLGVPLVAAFGPTNPLTTAPLGQSRLVRSNASCAPCLKRVCPLKKQICFDDVTAEKVAEAALEMLSPPTPDPDLKPAVFLDRDGTLNEEVGFLSRPDQISLTPGAGPAVAGLNKAGYRVVVVSNQSGVARGLFTANDVDNVHQRLSELLAEDGGTIDAFYFCPHHPDGVINGLDRICNCRKPATGLYKLAARDLKLDLSRSIWVGDRQRDLAGAEEFGGRSVLVMTGYGLSEVTQGGLRPTLVAPNLKRAVEWILS